MEPTEKLIEIEDKIKEHKDILLELMKSHEEEIYNICESDPNMVKGVCPVCDGKGFIQSDSSKKLCYECDGREWIWFKLYTK